MLIRSQDKKSLYNLSTNKGLWISNRAKGYTIVAEGLGEIGTYSSESKAIKVLDMIQAHAWSEKQLFIMPSDEEVEG
jgi:hypothetical protein